MNCFSSFSYDVLLCCYEHALAGKVELRAPREKPGGRAQYERRRNDDVLAGKANNSFDCREAACLTDDAHDAVPVAFCKQFADGDLLLQPDALSASYIDDGLFHKYLRS